MVSNSNARSVVGEVLERFMQLISSRNMEVHSEFVSDNNALLVGSDKGEIAKGQSEIRQFFTRIFARYVTFSWEANWINAFQAGNLMWFFADGEMTVESPQGQKKGPYRISGVVEQIGDHWLWRQYHGSEPVAVD
jgi:ketosteroid isomerase-like protein